VFEILIIEIGTIEKSLSAKTQTTKAIKQEKPHLVDEVFVVSDRDRIRTCDRLLRRQMLYPAELLDHF
tara:strand:+ start:104 stop:307 length:204 start_codon:yes stop_codon:yes gene_type:complete